MLHCCPELCLDDLSYGLIRKINSYLLRRLLLGRLTRGLALDSIRLHRCFLESSFDLRKKRSFDLLVE